jgi:hypothetical protein
MANRRLFMFNAGCADEPCCAEDEPEPYDCPDVCVTVSDPAGAPLSGVTVNGYALGSHVTGADGRVCFAIDGPGRYAFDTSLSGYNPGGIEVDVTEADCAAGGSLTKEEPITQYPTTRPPWCRDYIVTSCNCRIFGASLTFTTSNGYSFTGTTDRDGRVRVCIPVAYQTSDTVTYNATVSMADHVTRVIAGSWSFAVAFQGEIVVGLVLVDQDQRYCVRRMPGGTGTRNCLEYVPGTLTVTLGGTWTSGVSGGTYTLALTGASGANASYSSGCLATPPGATYTGFIITVSIFKGPGGCGDAPNASIQVRFLFNGHPVCTSSADDESYSGGSTSEPGGSAGCPVSFFTGFARTDIGDTGPYTTARTATVSE